MPGRYPDLGHPVAEHPLTRDLLVWLLPRPNNWGGATVFDLLGRATAAINSTGVTWAGPAGRPGGANALSFAGGAADYAQATVTPSLTITGGTAACWVYPRTVANFSRVVDAHHANGFWIGRNGTASQFGGAIRSNNQSPFGAFAAVPENAWSHILIARTGSVTTCYLNGVAASTFDAVSTADAAVSTIALGQNRTTSTGGDRYTGLADDVAVWGRTLSADEAWLWYDQSRRGHPDTLRRYTPRAYLFAPPPAGTTVQVSYGNATQAGQSQVLGAALSLETASQAGQSPVLNFPMVFETTTGARPWEAIDGPLEFETEVDLLAAAGGSLESAPPAGDFAFETVVGVLTPIVLSPPVLVHYATVTDAGEALSFGVPMDLTTVTGARGRFRTTIDGRIDLIGTRRYRR